jgi:LmbE family N-acetylglucosaminyl deacetylase
MNIKNVKNVAIIVAHPDDEILWAGGTILSHPSWKCFIISLCRSSDKDRAPRFYESLKVLKAEGVMGDLDDGPGQIPLDEEVVKDTITKLLPSESFDLIISHSPSGEYTKHLRHEETGKAVHNLWSTGKISSPEFWTFAYEDGNKEYFPRPVESANIFRTLTKRIWIRKYSIITETYGFKIDSWEAITTPRAEAFWQYTKPNGTQK